jgi:hypothetical protein
MSPTWRRQLSKHKGKTLVELCRRPKIKERIAGFVVGYSESLILLHRLDWNTFILDGYTILRDKDVKKKRFFTRSSYWQNKAIKKLGLRSKPLPGLALRDWCEAIGGISRRFPLIHLEREIAYPRECYIGAPLETINKILVLDNLDPDAKWTGPWSFKLNEITRIDFGGGYERALAATAPKRMPKVLRQYGHNLWSSAHQKL